MSRRATTLASFSATAEAVTGPCVVTNFHLAAGSDAATLIIRDGDDAGPFVAKLAAVANGNDDIKGCFRFVRYCHITLTGTSPVATLAIENPQANQPA